MLDKNRWYLCKFLDSNSNIFLLEKDNGILMFFHPGKQKGTISILRKIQDTRGNEKKQPEMKLRKYSYSKAGSYLYVGSYDFNVLFIPVFV